MPIGYLVGVSVVALPTLFALAPQRSVPNLSFRLGLLLNEVPIVGFYWLVIDTALAFAQGDINTAGGWATRPQEGDRLGAHPRPGVRR